MAKPAPVLPPSKFEKIKIWFQKLKKDKKRLILYCVLLAVFLIILIIMIGVLVYVSSLKGNRKRSVPFLSSSTTTKEEEKIMPGHAADTEFAQECMESHNRFRAKHGVPPLVWDQSISAWAQEWAEENSKLGKMKHSMKKGFGENLWSSSGRPALPCTKAGGAWYGEINLYNFNDPKFETKTGHFTQLVWKKSKLLGCGVAKERKVMFISCSYKPPGNSGGYKVNVPPLIARDGET